MKNQYIPKSANGRLNSFLSLAISLAVFAAFMLPSALSAQTYTKIVIYPEDVGVFYNIGQQQFEAYGVTASGQTVRITDKVDWYLDKNPFPIQTLKPGEVAEISDTGLLKVKSKWGRVNVKACYPKGCGPNSSKAPVGIDLLLAPKYSVTPSGGTGGRIDPDSAQTVKEGRAITFALIPDDTTLEAASITGTCPLGSFSTGATSYTTAGITDDCTVIVNFAQKPVITASVDPTDSNGTISPVGTTQVGTGQTKTFTLTPDDVNTETSSISGTCPAGSFTPGDTSYTTGPITSDCTVIAHFTTRPVVTSSVDPTDSNGNISPLGDTAVVTDQSLTFTLTPGDAGTEASSISGTCPAGSFNADHSQYTTGAITADCTVIAHFTAKPVVTSSIDPTDSNGSISPLGGTPVVSGQSLTLTITPNPGFEASSVDGTCLAGSFNTDHSQYTTGVIAADCTVNVHFTVSPVVTSSTDPTDSNGVVSPLGETSVLTGQTLTFTLTPNDLDTEASSITGDCPAGSFAVGDTSYTTGAIVIDCEVVVHFTAKPVVTSSVDTTDSGGSISPLGPTSVGTGQTQTFTLTPLGGYEASSIGGTCTAGAFTPGDASYTTGAIISDCSVVAHFTAPAQYTLAVTATGGSLTVPYAGGTITSSPGTIECGTPLTVGDCSGLFNSGENVTLTANALTGSFVSWSGDCSGCGASTTCPVTMNADINCTGTFGP